MTPMLNSFWQFASPKRVFFFLAILALIPLVRHFWARSATQKTAASATDRKVLVQGAWMVGVGFVLFWIAAIPYALVLKSPYEGFLWDSRHCLLQGLPVALLIFGAIRMGGETPFALFSRQGGRVLLYVLIALFSFTSLQVHTSLQARWVKDRSIMENMKDLKGVRQYSTFFFDERLVPHGGFGSPIGITPYAEYEWCARLAYTFGSESWVGLRWDYRSCYPKCLQLNPDSLYVRGTWNRDGAYADIWVRPGESWSGEMNMVAQYAFRKMFMPSSLVPWLKTVTRLSLTPAPRDLKARQVPVQGPP
jgi:hypothetical protein